MKTTNSKIMGKKTKINSMSSYDVAFRLSRILRLYQKRYSSDDDITIYPSGWHANFFEIMIRCKSDCNSFSSIELQELSELLDNHIPKNWFLSKKIFNRDGDVCGTPVKLQFVFRSV